MNIYTKINLYQRRANSIYKPIINLARCKIQQFNNKKILNIKVYNNIKKIKIIIIKNNNNNSSFSKSKQLKMIKYQQNNTTNSNKNNKILLKCHSYKKHFLKDPKVLLIINPQLIQDSKILFYNNKNNKKITKFNNFFLV